MQIIINIKKGDKVYVLEDMIINEYFVEEINIKPCQIKTGQDISHHSFATLERYNNGIDSFKKIVKLAYCYFSKEDLLKNIKQN